MNHRAQDNNQVALIGMITTDPVYSHTIYGEAFYTMQLQSERYSDRQDELPLIVSEKLFDESGTFKGRMVRIKGQFRSHNRMVDGHSKLILTIFVKDIDLVEDEDAEMENYIFLEGYVCKLPSYRKTPLGREISDVLLAVNREYDHSDYLPCICWGRNAKYARNFKVGEHVRVWGRVQSRDYEKRHSSDMVERKTAYEVSVGRIDALRRRKPKSIDAPEGETGIVTRC